MNIYKQLKNVYGITALDNSTVSQGSEVLRKVKQQAQWRTSLRLPIQQGQSWPLIFMKQKGIILVDIMPCGQTINSDLYIQTLKTLQKHFKTVWPTKTWL
jgi:hypothetical protein